MNISRRIINCSKTIASAFSEHVLFYPSPINLNYIWSFGSLVGLFFALQLITGIFLAMHYTAHVDLAFDSVVHIMNDVKNGWLMRYMHANGASMVFILIYCHIAKGLYYRSYLYSRRYLWWSGIIIFILMMATAFIGYVLPWGQMSFWGATVITSLVTAIPFVGENIAYWIWGGFSISNATLVRFFSLHYLLPFLITAIILLHLVLLHKTGSTEPTQSTNSDKSPFHPYFTYKDGYSLAIFLLLFIVLVFFYPNLLGHSDNFIKANPLVTPAHIVPEWYFTPFYAILRACPNKLGGVISMGAALLILFLLPFYTITWRSAPSAVSSFYKSGFWCFFFIFLTLMFLGGQAAAAPFVMCSKIFTFLYFIYFLIVLPFADKFEEQTAQVQPGIQPILALLAISGEWFAAATEKVEKGLTGFTSPAGAPVDGYTPPPLFPEDEDGRLKKLLDELEELLKHVWKDFKAWVAAVINLLKRIRDLLIELAYTPVPDWFPDIRTVEKCIDIVVYVVLTYWMWLIILRRKGRGGR